MANSWQISKRGAVCAICERPFAEGDALFSLLRFAGEDLTRGDYCRACFDDRDTEDDLVFWRTTHQEKKGGMKLDFDLILGLLEPLTADARGSRRDLAFMLSLLLVRHRRLKLVGVLRRKEVEFLELRKVRATKTFEVEVRELDTERRSRLTHVFSDLMDPTQEVGVESLLAESAEEEPSE